MKSRNLILLTVVILLCLTAFLSVCAESLDEALAMISSGADVPELIEISDDFSHLVPLGETEYEPAYGKTIVLWREAPLKRFFTSDTNFPADYEGEDIGDPTVYLVTDIMRNIPADQRAATASQVQNVLMIEDYYFYSGVIYSTSNAGDSLPSMSELESVMAGEEIPEDTGEYSYNYRPVFTGIAFVSLYNNLTGAQMLWDFKMIDHPEMRDNPKAANTWDAITDMVTLVQAAFEEGADLDEAVSSSYNTSDTDKMALSGLTDDPQSLAVFAYSRLWELANDLRDLDPEAAEYYDEIIAEESFQGLSYLANMRGYSGVSASDDEVRDEQLYIGIPSPEVMRSMLDETAELIDLAEWDIPLLFSALTSD